jgi:radical SAM protein with 4Fe4S-binding SPASM domain
MAELFLDGSKLMHHLPRVNRWRKGERIAPVHVEISPTSGCNQRCSLCYVDYLGHKAGLLKEEILVRLADEFAQVGVKSVLLAGEGEPTVNQGIVPMIQKAARQGVDMAINSNAVLLKKEMSQAILPHLTWARFTFQAGTPELYRQIHKGGPRDYERAVANVSEAVRIKREGKLAVTLGIQQILINENYRDVLNTAKLAKELGVDYYVVKRFSKHPKNDYDVPEDLYKKSLDLFEECQKLSDERFQVIVRWKNFTEDCNRTYRKCIGIPFITQILADGGVYPCSQFFKDPGFCFGNLHEKSFKEIIFGDQAQAVAKKIENEVDVTQCISYCRHHSTNMFLSKLQEEPEHVNFI